MLEQLISSPTVSRGSNLDLIADLADLLGANGGTAQIIRSEDGRRPSCRPPSGRPADVANQLSSAERTSGRGPGQSRAWSLRRIVHEIVVAETLVIAEPDGTEVAPSRA